MCLLYFLYKNGKWLNVDKEGLYKFAKGIARTKPVQRSAVLANIHGFLLAHIVDF